jgi:hypothetical protein
MIETAEEEGWFFNEKKRQFWCMDCSLSHSGNAKLPDISEIAIPCARHGLQEEF